MAAIAQVRAPFVGVEFSVNVSVAKIPFASKKPIVSSTVNCEKADLQKCGLPEIKFDSEIKETQIKSLKVEDDQEKTNNWWYSIVAVVAVLLISIILILVRKLHKKNILLEEVRKAASH